MIVFQVMGSRLLVFLLIIYIQTMVIVAQTNAQDFAALSSLKANWQNTPPNWVGSDPCGKSWDGIQCKNSSVTSIILSGIDLTGTLSEDIQLLAELEILDLSSNNGLTGTIPQSIGNLKKLLNLTLADCSFFGSIPDTIGSLTQLQTLDLNSNDFTGPIPPSIGNLSNIFLLDLTGNKINGTIPVSDGGTTHGLDMLVNAEHFHLGNNQLSGTIPPELFSSNMKLIHLLFDSNQLDGSIPPSIGLVQTLQVLRLDRNSLNGSIPSNFTNLTNISELYLSNNYLTGPLPNLTGMNLLTYLDLSNNSFAVSAVPTWFSSLEKLTSLIMEHTQLQGELPSTVFSLPQLQTVVLRNNQFNGTLDIGTSYGSQLALIDLTNNSITQFILGTGYNNTLTLKDNPICQKAGSERYCTVGQQPNFYSTPANNCVCVSCNSDQKCSPNCNCAYPITGTIHFMSQSFSDLGNASYYMSLQETLMDIFRSRQLSVDSISLSNPSKDEFDYLELTVDVFPLNQNRFTRTNFSEISSLLNNLIAFNHPYYGPSFSKINNRGYFIVSKSSSTGIIIGAATGGSILALLFVIAGLYAYRQKRRAEKATQLNNPFASWERNESIGDRPQLKGVRFLTFEELKKCTNNFSDANIIGSGGYGKVYRGTLATGILVAIKRAQRGSLQGSAEFKSEIELLSRVHHKNLVGLVGFCYELGEQMLVYEYIPNGSLKETLSGKSGIQLSWIRRLKIALGSAKGLLYLHELANPPIIHRDIKSPNILLDDQLNAKVSDFGLSLPLSDSENGQIITEVKGTLGYLDPEYYTTQQLTEKSDVYSFGVVLLELITARNPIDGRKYIVREVEKAMDNTKYLYGLQEILDPAIGLKTTVTGLEKFVDLAMRCVHESGSKRPTMGEVVKEIENILQLAGLDPNAESVSTSQNFDQAKKGSSFHPFSSEVNTGSSLRPYSNEAIFQYSGSFPHPR